MKDNIYIVASFLYSINVNLIEIHVSFLISIIYK